MPLDALISRTDRRTIVKTGVKLAYAAPAVAATMKLSARGAAAASAPSRQLTVLGTTDAGASICATIDVGQTCWSASGLTHLCLGDAVRSECPQVPSGGNDVCNPGNTCCGGSFLCGELIATLNNAVVGSGASGCADGPGELCFYVHDLPGYYFDNDGQYLVTLS